VETCDLILVLKAGRLVMLTSSLSEAVAQAFESPSAPERPSSGKLELVQ